MTAEELALANIDRLRRRIKFHERHLIEAATLISHLERLERDTELARANLADVQLALEALHEERQFAEHRLRFIRARQER